MQTLLSTIRKVSSETHSSHYQCNYLNNYYGDQTCALILDESSFKKSEKR